MPNMEQPQRKPQRALAQFYKVDIGRKQIKLAFGQSESWALLCHIWIM